VGGDKGTKRQEWVRDRPNTWGERKINHRRKLIEKGRKRKNKRELKGRDCRSRKKGREILLSQQIVYREAWGVKGPREEIGAGGRVVTPTSYKKKALPGGKKK